MAPDRGDVVLGVDLGTSATKVVAFDTTGASCAAASREHALHEPRPGQAVQDPEAVRDAALDAVAEAAQGARAAGRRIAGLSFSTAMHSLVGLDEEGRPLTDLMIWADQRASAQAERLRAIAGGHELHRRTGTPLHPMSPLAKLMWFRDEEPETFAAVRRWAGIKDLLLHGLTGEWAIDHSSASGTGLMGLATLEWDPEALEHAGVRAEALPGLVASTWIAPLAPGAAARLGLESGLAVVAGGGDGPLANLGVGAVRPGVAACSIGTSGAIRVVVERPGIDPHGRVFCYGLAPGRWVVGGAINNGGVVMSWAGEALAPDLGEHSEAELSRLAGTVAPGSHGLIMLPYLLSERAPRWSGVPRGAYVGLTRAHGRAHLVRAALEGVCLQLALVLRSIEAAGHDVHEMRATGGFARSPQWRQMLADALDMEVGFPDGHEGSSFGAALVGMQAIGLIDDIGVAESLVTVERVVTPGAEARRVYRALLPVFEALYDALEPTYEALRRLDPQLTGPGESGAR